MTLTLLNGNDVTLLNSRNLSFKYDIEYSKSFYSNCLSALSTFNFLTFRSIKNDPKYLLTAICSSIDD